MFNWFDWYLWFQVVFFHPVDAGGIIKAYKANYSLSVEEDIDVAFYFDLITKSMIAIKNMKNNLSWPQMDYTMCSEFNQTTPIERSIDLKVALAVSITSHNTRKM